MINYIRGNGVDKSENFQTSITIRGGAITDNSYKYFHENNFEGFYNITLDQDELHNLAYSEDKSIQNLKLYYSDLLSNTLNSYRQFEVPNVPERITILSDSSQFIITWETAGTDEVFYEIMLSGKSNFSKSLIVRSDTNILILDKGLIKSKYAKIRSLNPKYNSEWSPPFELNFTIQDILLKDPVITIFDFNGKRLVLHIKISRYIEKCTFNRFH